MPGWAGLGRFGGGVDCCKVRNIWKGGGCYGSSDSSGSDSLPSATTCSDLNFLDEYGLVVVRTQTKIS
jgi:hypothetical protein